MLLLTLAVFQFSSAQQDSKNQFTYGAQAGINLANFTEDQDFENRIGLNAGIFVSYDFLDSPLSFTSGLLYSQLGAKRDVSFISIFDGPDLDYKASLKLDYLKIPLFIEYEVIPNASLFIGPQIGFLVGNKEQYEFVEDGLYSGNRDFDFESENVQELSLSATLGVKVFLYKNIFVQGQYEFGVYDIFKDEQFAQDTGRTFSYEEFRHSVFTASLGYQF
ncbi:hypothetical protein NMS_0583 [Nonlabens marinus S1-08]|uniref:Outer membrane protein beta-barrel domain-containing protein n=1 Tax=Nonlabens marinus S1-08 TaxID=1454201 RepID=W8VWA8_9FLAO|nr:hypothetical protein NMS_0583 [Nonlabens marinus S1-08]